MPVSYVGPFFFFFFVCLKRGQIGIFGWMLMLRYTKRAANVTLTELKSLQKENFNPMKLCFRKMTAFLSFFLFEPFSL